MSENSDYVGFLSPRIVIQGRSYLNILYHILSFPLGLFYFVFLVTALSVGAGVAVVWVGIPIFLGTLVASRGFAAFERVLINGMLGADIQTAEPLGKAEGLINRIKGLATSGDTWKGVAYLLIKFPLGTLSFSLSIALVSSSVGLIATPILAYLPGTDYPWYWENWAVRIIESPTAVIALAVFGLLLAFISLHILKGLARLHLQLARRLLGSQTI